MATEQPTKRRRQRTGFRYQIEVVFPTDSEKKCFIERLDSLKKKMVNSGQCGSDNRDFMEFLLKCGEKNMPDDNVDVEEDTNADASTNIKSMLDSSGVFSYEDINENELSHQQMFICEYVTLQNLVTRIGQPCDCNKTGWIMSTLRQLGHVIRVEFTCKFCKRRKWWASSRGFDGKYLVNQKCVHAFTCAGILPSQYINFGNFAGIGAVGKSYIGSVYKTKKYTEVINKCMEVSITRSMYTIKNLPRYQTHGEWVITDARHDSTSNAFHSTVPCLSGSTHRILGCVTLSRNEHRIAQTREVECTRKVLSEVISKGMNVVEVAHDNSATVKNCIERELKLRNSYDTWHGTKNVAKGMTKIATGPQRTAGVQWFPQLSDKSMRKKH